MYLVRTLIHVIGRSLFRAGGLGIFTLSAFDSSPLVVPLGNDLLVLALTARHHQRMIYYVAMATLGSLLGCFVTDWLARKSDKAMKKLVPRKYLDPIRARVKEHAAPTLIFASLLPPPAPFTAFVAAAAAFRYPRQKLLGFVAIGRFMRFAIEGALAILYGRWIVKQAESPWLEHVMIVLVVLSIAGSAVAIFRWRSNGADSPAHGATKTA